ncbi:MAG: hypothetical protein H5T61_03535 [Thermoflexales bacterium]|nr:hypothetical protein [Thermoflexales bacterium]
MKKPVVVRAIWSIGLTLGLALALAATVHAALDWIPAETANVSRSGEARNVALAVGSGGKAAAWWVNVTLGDRRGDLMLAQHSGSGWVTQTVTTTLEARWPSIVYSGTTLFLAWFQGQLYTQPATALGGWVWEQEFPGIPQRVTDTLFYGGEWFRPRLRVGSDGVSVVFAAALTSTRAGRGDLYYFHRPPFGPWSSTVVVTSDQVAAGESGGVFYPDLAFTDGKAHLVWEQLSQSGSIVTYTVFYISATVGSGGPLWGTPLALSPSGENGQRPAIAADEGGRVHVAWTDYITDTEQYVRYRRLDNSGWSSVQTLSGDEPLRVNKIRPTVVWPAVAARGDQVCVAWHGFYPDATAEAEEVYLRCSRDGGQTWGTVMNVSRSPDRLSLIPALTIGTDGTVHVLWEEFQGGNSYFYNYDALYAAGPPEVHAVFLPIVLRNG